MSRVHLAGEGAPIPISALPDPNLDSNFPPQGFLFTESGTFDKTDYEGLGYTHFEVICIGAAGGKGGPGLSLIIWDETITLSAPIPPSLYTAYVNYLRTYIYPDLGGVPGGYGDPIDVRSDDFRVPITRGEATGFPHDQKIAFSTWALTYFNTSGPPSYSGSKRQNKTVYSNPHVGGDIVAEGGGGGGGGRHVAAGLLADLDVVTAIVVGLIGADAPAAQSRGSGAITPSFVTQLGFDHRGDPYFDWAYSLSDSVPTFPQPVAAADGGGTSFGGFICQASGGKGGGASLAWPGGVKTFTAPGGQGGAGNRIVAGGGAAGSTTPNIPGTDGTWDGVIGKGGGGGIGGVANDFSRYASHGGRGSYSFADPSVYGPRQQKDGIIPGDGGGALLTPGQYYGSKAPNSHPNGAVYLRLTKIS